MAAPGLFKRVADLIADVRISEAKSLITPLIIRHPRDPEVLAAAANLSLYLLQPEDAEKLAFRAVSESPHQPGLWTLYGVALSTNRKPEEADLAFQEALKLNPTEVGALSGRVSALRSLHRYHEAIAVGTEYEAIAPSLDSLASAVMEARSVLDSEDAYRYGLSIIERIGPSPYLTLDLALLSNYLGDVSQAETLQHGKDYSAVLVQQGQIPERVKSDLDPDRLPVIGLISSDFRGHAVANFLVPLVKALKSLGYKVFGYHYGGASDAVTDKFKKLIPLRILLPKQEREFVATLVRDRVEMLFDLSGHTAGGFSALFVQKLCPCYVHYLGYPNTTGMPGLRFRLVDETTDALEDAGGYTERLVRMQPPFLCFEPFTLPPAIRDRPKDAPLRLGSFNNFQKLSRETVSLWSDVLKAIPSATLALKATNASEPEVREAVLAKFRARGVEDRVELLPGSASVYEHLEQYNSIDIGLDPTPYNGTTTTCDALMMGVPVVTLAGIPHRSRVGATLIGQDPRLGVVAQSQTEFVNGVVELSRQRSSKPEVAAAFRSSLTCDIESFAERLSPMLKMIWTTACQETEV